MREVNEVVKEMPAVSGISTWYFVISFFNIWNGKEEFKKAEGLVALKKQKKANIKYVEHVSSPKDCCAKRMRLGRVQSGREASGLC